MFGETVSTWRSRLRSKSRQGSRPPKAARVSQDQDGRRRGEAGQGPPRPPANAPGGHQIEGRLEEEAGHEEGRKDPENRRDREQASRQRMPAAREAAEADHHTEEPDEAQEGPARPTERRAEDDAEVDDGQQRSSRLRTPRRRPRTSPGSDSGSSSVSRRIPRPLPAGTRFASAPPPSAHSGVALKPWSWKRLPYCRRQGLAKVRDVGPERGPALRRERGLHHGALLEQHPDVHELAAAQVARLDRLEVVVEALGLRAQHRRVQVARSPARGSISSRGSSAPRRGSGRRCARRGTRRSSGSRAQPARRARPACGGRSSARPGRARPWSAARGRARWRRRSAG